YMKDLYLTIKSGTPYCCQNFRDPKTGRVVWFWWIHIFDRFTKLINKDPERWLQDEKTNSNIAIFNLMHKNEAEQTPAKDEKQVEVLPPAAAAPPQPPAQEPEKADLGQFVKDDYEKKKFSTFLFANRQSSTSDLNQKLAQKQAATPAPSP